MSPITSLKDFNPIMNHRTLIGVGITLSGVFKKLLLTRVQSEYLIHLHDHLNFFNVIIQMKFSNEWLILRMKTHPKKGRTIQMEIKVTLPEMKVYYGILIMKNVQNYYKMSEMWQISLLKYKENVLQRISHPCWL